MGKRTTSNGPLLIVDTIDNNGERYMRQMFYDLTDSKMVRELTSETFKDMYSRGYTVHIRAIASIAGNKPTPQEFPSEVSHVISMTNDYLAAMIWLECLLEDYKLFKEL